MNRIVLVIASLMLISGLGVVHFSLANAQRGLAPSSVHGGTPEGHTPTITNTPTSTPGLPSAYLSLQNLLAGPVGTGVRVQGFNFAPSQIVSITFDGESVATAEANSVGHLEVTFLVPEVSPGNYQVLVGVAASVPFFVTPTIHACSANHKTDKEQQGQLRIVSDPLYCKKDETAISWSQW